MTEFSDERSQRKAVDNSSYRERFQFIVSVNDNIICQRYFKINKFNNECLTSEELFDVFYGYSGIIQLIQRDLESKSRIYTNATAECRTKLTGFDGNSLPTYVEWEPKPWDETEFVKPWDVTFKFMFLVDDRVVYEHVWDGSQYPKYVRNSVDLTNSRSQYPLVQLMNNGKRDLVVEIIKRICAVASNMDDGGVRQYTKSVRYPSDAIFRNASNNSDGTHKVWSFDGKQGLVCEDCMPGPIECLQDKFPGACLENQIANEKAAARCDDDTKYLYSAYNKAYVNAWRSHRNKKHGPIKVS